MNDSVIQIIIAVTGSTFATSIVAAFFNRNKTKAEGEQVGAQAAQLIREAAAGMVKDYREENGLLRDRLDDVESQLRNTVRSNDELSYRLGKAVRAMELAVQVFQDAGVDPARYSLLQRTLSDIATQNTTP